METVRSILEWASSMEGSAELAPACRAVRDKLAMRDVVSVVQEFIGSLLYVALAAENAQGKHAGDETGQLADFLYQLCGLREQAEQSSSSGAHVRAALVEPCKSCACCHIAIQESMNLLRFVHNFATCSSGAATSETPCFEQRLPRWGTATRACAARREFAHSGNKVIRSGPKPQTRGWTHSDRGKDPTQTGREDPLRPETIPIRPGPGPTQTEHQGSLLRASAPYHHATA